MNKIWKDIPNYEGLYLVSNIGEVKSIARYGTKGKVLTIHYDKDGYTYVHLSKNGHKTYCHIHTLVALAFIDNPNKLPQINHKDENKTNNCVDNLEWCDCKYNINYGIGIKKRAIQRYKAVKGYYINDPDKIFYYKSMIEAEQNTGIHRTNISANCRGIISSIKGMVWSYA